MKISQGEVQALRELIQPLDTEAQREHYRQGNFPRANKVKDLDRRYQWDLFWVARGMSALTGEYKDSHIDTALRSIVPSLFIESHENSK